MTQPSRILPLFLPADLYDWVAEEATRAERDPIQQVRFVLREARAAKRADAKSNDTLSVGEEATT